MNLKVVAYVLSRLQFVVTLSICVPFVTALMWGEDCAMDFAGTILISLGIAVLLGNHGELEHENMTIREGLAVTGIAWLIISLIASLPYLAGHYLGYIDSIFEGVSGVTCTGASVIRNLDVIPRSVVLWRSITHWIGGIGIIVIYIAMFPQAGSSAARMFNAEGAGPVDMRVVPRMKSTANALLMMYVGMSMMLATILLMCGLGLFDAVNLSMSVMATGGFSTINGGMETFDSLPMEIAMIIFMLLAGGNFGLYFLAIKKGYKHIWRDMEFKVYIAFFVIVSLAVTLNLMTVRDMDVLAALRLAAFQSAAIMSTTGLTTCDINMLPSFSLMCMIMLMLIGGCGGSTSGGIKVSRVIILWKMLGSVIQEKLHPNSVAAIRMESQSHSTTLVYRVARFFFLYVALSLVAACIFALDGGTVVDSVMVGLSFMGNAGVGYEFYALPSVAKVVCCLLMIIGRLEIFSFVAMVQPGFWKRNSNW